MYQVAGIIWLSSRVQAGAQAAMTAHVTRALEKKSADCTTGVVPAWRLSFAVGLVTVLLATGPGSVFAPYPTYPTYLHIFYNFLLAVASRLVTWTSIFSR